MLTHFAHVCTGFVMQKAYQSRKVNVGTGVLTDSNVTVITGTIPRVSSLLKIHPHCANVDPLDKQKCQ